MKCNTCNGTGYVSIGPGIRGIKKCEVCKGTGTITEDKVMTKNTCPVCGTLFPTDDRMDYIPAEEIHFCYYCGADLKRRIGGDTMPDYKKFYEYWRDLYGTGLYISGWHMNGELEDFDNFFDSAVEYMEGVSYIPTFQGKTVNELWEEFGDVPMNPETECIEVSWRGFPSGTHREDIWHWFEEKFGVKVYDLMMGRNTCG